MALLYGRAGRLTAKNGCFRPGQMQKELEESQGQLIEAKAAGRDLEAQLEAGIARMAADTQEKTELERQLEASGANQHEAEDLHNDALASLEETIQGLEEEKSELQEQADQAETMMAKLRQDIEGLKVANMRASMKVPDGAHHCPFLVIAKN